MICKCGKETEHNDSYSHVIYNKNGEKIYAVCWHGHIVINKTGKWKEDYK